MAQVIRMTEEMEREIYGDLREELQYTAEGAKLFIPYCEEHSIFYYGRPKESFSEYEAHILADEAGCKYLILDNMS